MKNARLFIYNGLILTAASLLLRTLGVGFNIFITSRVGEVGTGLFQLVMSVYSPALTLASAGTSLASSRLVAEEMGKRRGNPRAVLSRCILFSQLSSLPIAVALFLLAPYISASWLGSNSASHLLRMLSVGLPFISLSSCVNGFFIALRKAKNSAAVQIAEQLFKMLITFSLIYSMADRADMCLLLVVFSNVCSDIFSVVISLCLCSREAKRLPKRSVTRGGISAAVLSITLPVSISSFLRSALTALEHILIPKGLLKSGLSYGASMAAYGTLTGMALPIIMFPASFLYSFSSLTVPEMAEANEKGDKGEIRTKMKQILGAFLIFSVGASGLIFAYGSDLGRALYGSNKVGYYLHILAPLIPIMYLDNICDSMLKGLGEQIFTMKVNVIDAASCVLCVFFLVPRVGIMGYVAVILLSELINFGFSVFRLKKVTGEKTGLLAALPKPLISVIAAILLTKPIVSLFDNCILRTVVGITLGALVYTAIIFGEKAIRDKVIKMKDVPYNGARKRSGEMT
ncbi:MAG: oligosaccharide flippase family protein [Clostridia bacterium]|nr:oligosaccharide flippase family protein [Clostridia bacterium]